MPVLILRRAVLLAGTLGCLFAASKGHAFNPWSTCPDGTPEIWNSQSVEMTLYGVSWVESLRQPMRQTMRQWHQLPGADFSVTVRIDHDEFIINPSDGINSVAAANDDLMPAGWFAYTEIRGIDCPPAQGFKEVEIVFNAEKSFMNPCCDTYFDYFDFFGQQDIVDLTVVLHHEMGHVTGLWHVDGNWDGGDFIPTLATMNTFYPAASFLGEDEYLERVLYVNEDDREGHRFMYPDSDGTHDLAAQAYVRDDVGLENGECLFADQRPAPFIPNFDFVLSQNPNADVADCVDPQGVPAPATFPPEPMTVLGGTEIDVAFNVANLGEQIEILDAEIVLTQDPVSFPHVVGTVVDTLTIAKGLDKPFLLERRIAIPDTLTPGLYYVVLYLDPGNNLGEFDEGNNHAYWNQPLDVKQCTCSSAAGPATMGTYAWFVLILVVRARRRHRRIIGGGAQW